MVAWSPEKGAIRRPEPDQALAVPPTELARDWEFEVAEALRVPLPMIETL